MARAMPPPPDFASGAVLRSLARACVDWFSRPACEAPEGGLHHSYGDAGEVREASARHLVSATRLCVVLAWAAARPGGCDRDRALLASCLAFLRGAHRDAAAAGGYAWTLRARGAGAALEVADGTNYAYGLAFCLLAYAAAAGAGVPEAAAWADEAWETRSARRWEKNWPGSATGRPHTGRLGGG